MLQPVFSNVADLFWWKTHATLTSITPGASGNSWSDVVKTLPGSVFVFCAWRGNSSWDSVTQLRAVIGSGPAAATALYPVQIPNNFSVMVKKNSREPMMGKAMPQAAIASSGYRAGNQVPYPIIYPPATMFDFEITNTAPVQLTAADKTTALALEVDFGLFGYNVPCDALSTFLQGWPQFYRKAMAELTGVTLPTF